MIVRKALCADAEILAGFRLESMRIIKDGGIPDEEGWRLGLAHHFARGIRSGRIHCWLALEEGHPRAAAAMRIEKPKSRRAAEQGLEGRVMSVFTMPQWRRQGFARALLEHLIAEAREGDLGRLILNPTEDGRRLYEECGFKPFRSVMILQLNE